MKKPSPTTKGKAKSNKKKLAPGEKMVFGKIIKPGDKKKKGK